MDPREELVRRLLEFQRYKEAAGILHQKGQIRAATWTRPDTVLPKFDDAGEEMLEAGLFDLIAPSRSCSSAARRCSPTRSSAEGKSVEERMDELLGADPGGRVARVPGAVRERRTRRPT